MPLSPAVFCCRECAGCVGRAPEAFVHLERALLAGQDGLLLKLTKRRAAGRVAWASCFITSITGRPPGMDSRPAPVRGLRHDGRADAARAIEADRSTEGTHGNPESRNGGGRIAGAGSLSSTPSRPRSAAARPSAGSPSDRRSPRLWPRPSAIGSGSSAVENLVRPIALTRKNALFAGHDEGAVTWGRIASLTHTARLNGVEPYAWLKATLEAIAAGHPNDRIDYLLLWNFASSSS